MASDFITAALTTPMKTGRGASVTREVIAVSFVAQNLAQNETWTIRALPAGTVVHSCMVKIATAQADVTDVDIGHSTDGTTGAQFIDGVSLAATGYKYVAGMTGPIAILADALLVVTNKDAQTAATGVMEVIIELSHPTWD